MRHSCQKYLGRRCRECSAGKTDSEIKLIHENRKPRDLNNVHSWLSHQYQPRAVRKGANNIHEDSAACTVSTSSLTTEVEAVAQDLRWTASRGDDKTTHAAILKDSISLLQKEKHGTGSPDWRVSMFDIHLRKLL